MHSSRILKRASAIAALVLGASLSITGCSSSDGEPTNAGQSTTSVIAELSESPSAEPSAPTISLSELKDGDRAMQVAACNTLLGSPSEIAKKLGLPVEAVEIQMENEEVQGNPSSPWSQAGTTKLANGQIDLACKFVVDANAGGTTYVGFGTVGDEGENTFCTTGLVCVATEDKQRVITIQDTRSGVSSDSFNEAPLKELLDKFTA